MTDPKDTTKRGDASHDAPESDAETATRGRGRPTVDDAATESLTIRIPAGLRERLDAAAESHGMTVGAVARAAIGRHLERKVEAWTAREHGVMLVGTYLRREDLPNHASPAIQWTRSQVRPAEAAIMRAAGCRWEDALRLINDEVDRDRMRDPIP